MHLLYFKWHWAYFHMFRSHLKLSYELCSYYLFTFLSDHDLFLFFNSSSHKESSLLLHELAIFFLVCIDSRKFPLYHGNMLCPHLFVFMRALMKWKRRVQVPCDKYVYGSVSCYFLKICCSFFPLWKLMSCLIIITNCTFCKEKVLFLGSNNAVFALLSFPLN